MSAQYSTPGVYIEELSLLPPSVAEVSTAIPAFVGYTETAKLSTADDLLLKPTRITSMMEYEALFGGPKKTSVEISRKVDKGETTDTLGAITLGSIKHNLYYQLAMFFGNGGGACYIVSVGDYTKDDKDLLLDGIKSLENEDEPTLLLVPESDKVYSEMLQHCKNRKDRFAILDANLSRNSAGILDSAESIRGKMMVGLDYGAAYTPNLQTSLSIAERDVQIKIKIDGKEEIMDLKDLAVPKVSPKDKITTAEETADLNEKNDLNRALYHTIKKAVSQEIITLPPSGTIAGVYARVDRERGVWKAPANVGLIGVLGPTIKINSDEQGGLNKDANSGKSINVIRSFPGQGTLVWGARTLDGNSNEWKYINVRRLFIMAEESIQKATQFAVFEPNTASTWLKVKAMIESYLFGLWQRGALAGAKPEQAYYVRVGLNVTMTQQDILNGIMRVDVGMAAVRPAEFIVLSFSHKLQES